MAGTTDESWHVDYGISILQGSGDRSAEPLLDSKMPVSALNALPSAIGKYLLVFQYGRARIWFAMSRDCLLPKVFSKFHPGHKTPHISTWIAGLVLMMALPLETWVRFFVWLLIGFAIYFPFSCKNSALARQ